MMLNDLSNEELLSRLTTICADSRRLLGQLILHLIEVEDRRLDLEAASPSLWHFCVHRLQMGEGEAFRRITATRLVRKFPALLGHVESGAMSLSTLVLLKDHLTAANFDELVATAS